MIGKPLAAVQAADIDALHANKVVELGTLEYKRDLPTTDDERREIVYDIASLANTRGGDLIFGIEAEKDAKGKATGAPGKIVGVSDLNFDDLRLRLLQTIENCTRPRIEQVEFVRVGTFERGPVVIVRVPQSWTGPHLMHLDKSQRFYARSSAGRYLMDVDQIRAAMLASASLPDRLDTLRRERIARIVANDGAHPLEPASMVAFHVVPFASLSRTLRLPIGQLEQLPMPSIVMTGGGNLRINFDGYLLTSHTREKVPVGYVQAFRSGVLESVMVRVTEGDPPIIGSTWIEETLLKAIRSALQGLSAIDVPPPYYVAITLIGVRGASLATSNYHREGPIDRDLLLVPEVEIDRAKMSVQETATCLRPAFDAIWQAAGAVGSFNYDEKGSWLEGRAR